MSADPSPLEVEVSQAAGDEADVAPAKVKSPRMHHLDWLRAMFIWAAVYLHVDQEFGHTWPRIFVRMDNPMFVTYSSDTVYYDILNQADPNWRQSYSGRYIMIGRQFCIPLLFWISGYALSLSKEKAFSAMIKIVIMTVVGMLTNAVIWFLGPQDDACSWYASKNDQLDYCAGKGMIWDFGIATGRGPWIQFLFQFWFTVFVIAFLLQLHPLCEGLRDLQRRSEGLEWGGMAAAAKCFGAYFAISAVFYLGLILSWSSSPDYDRTLPAILLTLGEIPYLGALGCAAACPAESPRLARALQYLAALLAMCQFVLPDLRVTRAFDGAMVIYFHLFKHFFSIGFVMALKRKQTAQLLSNYYPVALILLIVTASTTNYFESGIATYPYFPRVVDRVLWTAGGLSQMFVHDRLGMWATAAGALQPLPTGVGTGALLSYVFHVPLMAVFSPFADWGGPAGVTVPILITYWLIAYAMECGRKK